MGTKSWSRILASAHEMSVFAEVLNYRGVDMGLPPIPVTSLQWTVDATARPSRSGTMVLPLTPEWAPTSSNSPLTPFGNQVEVWVEIRGGGEFAKCRLGFALIKEVTVNRPEHTISVSLTDMTEVLLNSAIPQALPNKNHANESDWWWLNYIAEKAWIQAWTRDSDGVIKEPHEEGLTIYDPEKYIRRDHDVTKQEKWAVGSSRMSIIDEICQLDSTHPSWPYITRNGKLRIYRPALLDDTQAPGTATHAAVGGPGGALKEIRSRITRVGAINTLTVRNDHPKDGEPNTISTYHIKSGALSTSRVGKRNAVEEKSKRWTQKQLDDYTSRRLALHGGVRRQATITMMINPWIDPGDSLETRLDGAVERWTVKSISLSFPDGRMTVEGQGWVDDRSKVVEGWSPKPVQDPVKDDPPATESSDTTPATGGRYPTQHKFKGVENGLDNGAGTKTSVRNAVAVLRMLPVEFPKIKTVGGYRSGGSYPDHPAGLALDIMMPSGHNAPGSPALGNQIVRYLIRNQKRFAVDYLIWRQRIWDGSYGNLDYGRSSWMANRGSVTQNHYDHIHVLVHPYVTFSGRWSAVKRGKYWTKDSSARVAVEVSDLYRIESAR